MNPDTVQRHAGELTAAPPGSIQSRAAPPVLDTLDRAVLVQDGAQHPQVTPAGLEHAEAGLSVLLQAWQQAIEELGAMLPPTQVRALLIIETGGRLNVTGLARTLGASPSATSRLCDRMVAASLLARVPTVASRREIRLELTESGQRLAAWIRDQRRTALARVLDRISPEGRADLARGLSEVLGLTRPPASAEEVTLAAVRSAPLR